MALKHGEEFFTMFTHVEDDRVLNRRVHRIEIQARDGRLHVLEGKRLPTFIQTNTGTGFKGAHLMQILVKPTSWKDTLLESWPTSRDLVHGVLGILFCVLVRLLTHLAQGDF
ncbi:MAG: hypothetical protein L0Z62_23065 [Gemmataceae bacterium]|nr:hypothetical protein [Gemmataceae bacterium]